MKILVTGANGLIGRKTIKALQIGNKNQIFATSQRKIQANPNIEFFTVNLIYSDINKLVETLKPDVLIHCAALSSPDACEVDKYSCKKLNVEVTSRFATACRDYGTHLIFLSTDFIFDGKKADYTETDFPAPICYYGESKLEIENIIQDMKIGATIVRTSLVYGYEEHLSRSNIALRVIDHLKNGLSYRVPFDQIRTPTLAEDLALALITIAEKREGGVFNVSGGEKLSVYEFSKRIAVCFGFDESLLISTSTEELSEPAIRPLNTSLDITKAKILLNYQPTSLNDSLKILKNQLHQK
ncbi:MAG: SDR family oxidoreductase [Bacteroidales bacterium]|nr:SDR family oxidoreductase [Bacteroidales bacterium]